MEVDELKSLVEEEIETFRIDALKVVARSLLVNPRFESRRCRYLHSNCDIIVFAESSTGQCLGYPATQRSGVLYIDTEPWVVMDRDSEYFDYDWGFYRVLEDAFYATSDGGKCELPDNYEVR